MAKQHAQGFFCAGARSARRAATPIRARAVGRPRASKSKIPTASARRSPIPISTCTPKARSTRPTAPWARTWRRPTACPACASPSGRPTPRASPWPASSTIGTSAATPCGGATAASGRLFLPGLGEGPPYKYNVRSRFAGYQQLKADPYAFLCEMPPKSASVVWDIDKYQWRDDAWMKPRAKDRLAEVADLDLRGAPGIVAARPARPAAHLPRDGRQAGGVREADGLHPHRAAAHHGASVFRLVGLPGDRLLRAHFAFRHARRFQVLRGSPATRPASA